MREVNDERAAMNRWWPLAAAILLGLALAGLKVAGLFLGDVVLTPDEVKGLTREYLYVERPLRRGADFTEWLAQPDVASTLGRRYQSELARHFRA